MTADDGSARPYSGCFVGHAHQFALRVYYEDTDAGGVVYHANYLRFCERARSDMLVLTGIDHVAAAAAGEGHYVVVEANLRFRAPARLGDALLIVSRVVGIAAASCAIQQRVMRGRDLVVEADLTVAFVGGNGRPRRQPAAWRGKFEELTGAGKAG